MQAIQETHGEIDGEIDPGIAYRNGEFVNQFSQSLVHGGGAIEDASLLLKSILKLESWKCFRKANAKGNARNVSFEEFVTKKPFDGLGTTVAKIRNKVRDDPEALAAFHEALGLRIEVDPEFQGLIPPLSAEEFGTLEASIKAEGLRDPIVVWEGRGIILDGHNRYAICQRLGITIRTTFLDFADRDAVKLWMIRNQLGRRNLTDIDRIALAERLRPLLESKALANQSAGGGAVRLKSAEPVKVRDELAKASGFSPDKHAKGVAVLKAGTPELVQAVREKRVSVDAASLVAVLPETEQKAIVAEGPKAVREKAAEIRREKSDTKKKPESPPVEPVPTGPLLTRLNGVLVPDPPDVAAMRKKGEIAPDSIVEVDEPDMTTPEPEPEPEPPIDEKTYLDNLPLSKVLTGRPLRMFRKDAAFCFRMMERTRDYRRAFAETYRGVCRDREHKGLSDGEFYYKFARTLKTPDPHEWVVCPDPKLGEGGCMGTGEILFLGHRCPKCYGRGYLIPKPEW